jgi:DNA mismatch repair protein MutL
VSQQLLFPQELTLSLEEYALLEENEVEFASLGFDIVFRGEGAIEVNGTPADIDPSQADMLIYELLKLLDTPESMIEARRERLAATMAQSVARSMPSRISLQEASDLLSRLIECNNRSFTPSGKAIMAEISLEDLRNKLG